MAQPGSAEGFESRWRFHFKQDWTAVDEARGFGMGGPGGCL